jgi:sugar phosphate isomerase/epimerase
MKYGTQLGSLGRENLSEALVYARELGCEGLEVNLPVAGLRTGAVTLAALQAEAEQMREAFDAAGMGFISLTSGLILKNAQTPEVITATCRLAQTLGVRALRTFFSPHVRLGGPGSTLDKWNAEFDGSVDAPTWKQRDTDHLARVLELSEGYDVRYVFELHHGYWINSASAALRVLEAFPVERVGILMDPGNMVFEGNEGWRNSVQIMGPYLDYIHCKNAVWTQVDGKWQGGWGSLPGGIANYAEIVTALKDTGFAGYLSIEDLRGSISPDERIGEAIAYLKQLEASGERVMPV